MRRPLQFPDLALRRFLVGERAVFSQAVPLHSTAWPWWQPLCNPPDVVRVSHWGGFYHQTWSLLLRLFPFQNLYFANGGKAMPDQSTRKLPSQSDGQTKTNPFLDFQIPTLADLLKRLSIISATPASKVPPEPLHITVDPLINMRV
jgi:hypothetical protein